MSIFSVATTERRGFSDLQHDQALPRSPLSPPRAPSFPPVADGRAGNAVGETILRVETDEFSAGRRRDDIARSNSTNDAADQSPAATWPL